MGGVAQGNVLAELPSLLISPIVGPLPFSMFIAKLPYAFISTMAVLLLYLIIKELTKGKSTVLLAALALALNPWSIHFGRTSFEFTFSIFFYLFAVYLIIRKNGWHIFWALPFFLAGALSYHGAKLLFVPIIFVLLGWKYLCNRKINIKPLLALAGISLLLLFSYTLTLKYQPSNNRSQELIFYDTSASGAVDDERRLSLPGVQQELFSNKATYSAKKMVDIYLTSYSTDFLFLRGENRGAYSFWYHGLFYYVDSILILLGILGLFTLNKRALVLILLIIAISPLPSVLSNSEKSFVIRSGLMFPFLTSLAGIGVWFLLKQTKRYKALLGSFISVIYFVSVANFLNLYFTRYPVYASEGFFLSHKILSKYINLAINDSTEPKVIVSATEPKIVFEKYLFYNNLYNNKQAINEINSKIANKEYGLSDVKFIDKCDKPTSTNTIWIYEQKMNCEKEQVPSLRISSLSDGGFIWTIKEDKVWGNYNLAQYPRVNNPSEFDLYKLSSENFCKIWISRL